MLKNISKLGSALNQSEQKSINGGSNCWAAWDRCAKENKDHSGFDKCMQAAGCGVH